MDLRIYAVSLRRRADRRRQFRSQLDGWDVTFTSDWQGPFDGLDLDVERLGDHGYALFDWRIESDNPWWSRPLKLGEIGCALSHLACWHDAGQYGAPYTLILEDDAVLIPAFFDRLRELVERAETAGGFDLLYLGRVPLEPDTPWLPGLVKPGYSHCTFAYLLSLSAVRTLLRARLDRAIVPVDEFLPAMYLDHPRPDLRVRFPRQLVALAADPPLVTQRPKSEAGSDTEASAFVTLDSIVIPGSQGLDQCL